jgi:dTDP-glucose pyrophosphorylase
MRDLNLISITPEKTIKDALAAIDEEKLEIAILVNAGKKVLGVVTDGDIRRALLSGKQLTSPVGEIANREFIFARPDAGRNDVLDLMKSREVRQVPILDAEGRLVGMHLLRELLGTIERKNAAVIFAGGRGVRLRPVTDHIPKPMLLVAGRPIMERLILHLVGFGVRKFYIALHYLPEVIEKHFGDGSQFGCEISYLREDKPLGTAGALGLIRDELKDSLLVMNGDLVTQFDVHGFLQHHAAAKGAITVGATNHCYEVPFGVLRLENDGSVTGIEEKPMASWMINSGIYALQPDVLQLIQPSEAMGMPDLIARCMAKGRSVQTYRLDDEWIDVGRPDQLQYARKASL